MRKVLMAVFLTGLFMLMLSALVVTPEDALGEPVRLPPADVHAVFMPMPAPDVFTGAEMVQRPVQLRNAALMAAVVVLCAVMPVRQRDSNGRVLTARRYENSVYQVFRPEVAGG